MVAAEKQNYQLFSLLLRAGSDFHYRNPVDIAFRVCLNIFSDKWLYCFSQCRCIGRFEHCETSLSKWNRSWWKKQRTSLILAIWYFHLEWINCFNLGGCWGISQDCRIFDWRMPSRSFCCQQGFANIPPFHSFSLGSLQLIGPRSLDIGKFSFTFARNIKLGNNWIEKEYEYVNRTKL